MTDPIADLLTRIRNAFSARHDHVSVPTSKVKEELVRILKETGYVSNFVKVEASPQSSINIFLKYDVDGKPIIHEINRVSRPGRRVYLGYKDIRPFLRGMGTRVLSTPKGLMTDKQARYKKVGGEVLCEIW